MADFNFVKKAPGLTTLLALELILLLIVSYQIQVSKRVNVLEKTGLMILGPVQELNENIVGSVSKAFERNRTRAELLEENAKLHELVESVEQIRTQLEESELENNRLRDLLELPKHQHYEYVAAQVTGRAHRRNDYMITINRGSRSGIQRDVGVFGPNGVVGVVWEVSGSYAKVMTVNNPSSAIASMVQDSRYSEAYVSGYDLTTGRLENYPNFENIRFGQLVITSGLDGMFPKGLHIGRVRTATPSYTFQNVNINFSTDFSRLEEVIVLVPRCEEGEHELE